MMKDNFKLEDIPKRNIYQVPENYFDRLPMRVMERTAAQEQVKERSGELAPWWRPLRLAVAPLVLLLIFVGTFFLTDRYATPETTAVAVTDLASKDIVEYLSNYAHLDESDFEELSLSNQLAADFLNVSPAVAEEELEYYTLSESNF